MHISLPPQSHTPSTAATDSPGISVESAEPADTALQPRTIAAMANPYAVALNGLADIYLDKARVLRSQQGDPGSPDYPTVALAPADIRFLAHCGVTVEGTPVEAYINERNNMLGPLELEQLASEMRKRAATIEQKPASLLPALPTQDRGNSTSLRWRFA